MAEIAWKIKPFKGLSIDELYDILKLRVDVFVAEQQCPYPEIDGKDRHPETWHVTGWTLKNDLAAYLRILSPGTSFKQAGIGRIVVAEKSRGKGICKIMIQKAFDQVRSAWPGQNIKIGAQVYLKEFYMSLGFQTVSEPYLEDGIPHIDMIKQMNI